MDITYIRDNPATAAFQRAQQAAAQLEQSELQAERARLELEEARKALPSRLRSVTADADIREAQARVAGETAPYDVQIRREQASQAPIATQAATRAEAEAAATSPDRVAQSSQQTRLGQVKVEDAELDATFKVIDLLDRGDSTTARQVAKQFGVDIPEQVITNRLLIRQLKTLADQSKTLYPNSPKRQAQYLEEAVKGLTAGTQQQQNLSDPAYPFRVPNAPEPDMATGTAASAGRPLQFEVIQNAAKALGYSDEEAFAIASGRKPATDMELMELARKLTSMEMPSSDFRTSPEDRRQRYEAILADLRAKNGPAPSAAGASPPAGPAPATTAPAPNMQGQGTEQDPYQATTQEQVDWFKRSAPAGSVILIDGTLYVK